MPVSLLDSSLGIQDILREPVGLGTMPAPQQMASTVLHASSLEELYPKDSMRHMVEQLLCPDVGDGALLRPDVFPDTLGQCIKQLADNTNPHVRALLRDVLLPLQEDTQLLQTYTGLMIGS